MDRTKSKFNVEKGEREGKHLNKGAKGRKWEGWRGNIASREAKLISPRNQGVVRKSGDRLAIGKRERGRTSGFNILIKATRGFVATRRRWTFQAWTDGRPHQLPNLDHDHGYATWTLSSSKID